MEKREIDSFVKKYQTAFGNAELPFVFYFDEGQEVSSVTNRCFIGELNRVIGGEKVVLDQKRVACPGGKTYCGFAKPLPRIPEFVSYEERYKKTPEMVLDFLKDVNMESITGEQIVFERIDKVEKPEKIIGVIFFATPDVLTGLVSWTFFDSNDSDAVSVPFGSGCSSIIAQTYLENERKGKRCFMGMFDPSARPQVKENILSFAIPKSRFVEMLKSIDDSCLLNSNAWEKVKERINK